MAIDAIDAIDSTQFHRTAWNGTAHAILSEYILWPPQNYTLDSRMSDPSGNFAKLTCIGPKLNTYRAIFSTCELIVSSFTTTTSNFIDLISMANSQFLSGKFIVSHVSLWHKHSCASWSLFLTFVMAHSQDLWISVSYIYKTNYFIVFQAFWTPSTSGKQR